MAKSNFESLRVYQLSEALADEVWDIVRDWPNFARDTVGKQVVRSADGIGANISEGVGRQSFADNRRFVFMARGSLNETIHWLRRAFRRQLLSPEQVARIKPLLEQLPPMLNAYKKSIGGKRNAPSKEPSRQESTTSND